MAHRFILYCAALFVAGPLTGDSAETKPAANATHWEWCGWGGGGYMWSACYHPSRPGVIYMGGDCAGVYKTQDDGRNWRMINQGLANYAVYGLAVAPQTPDTVYSMTEHDGLCKSIDAGEHWQLLPETAQGKLNIYSERHVSVRPLAVDPSDSRIVYAATPLGKIYQSRDGAQSWKQVFQLRSLENVPADVLRVEFPAAGPFGAFFIFVSPPAEMKAEDCRGFGFSVKSNGVAPQKAFVTLWGPDGVVWRSKNLSAELEKTQRQDVVLSADDFTIDPDHARQKADRAPHWPKQPQWKTVNRMDFTCAGISKTSVFLLGNFYFALADGKKAVVRDFARDKSCNKYGNIHVGPPKPGAFASVTVSANNPRLVLAASPQGGVYLSRDAGESWEHLNTPQYAACVVADPRDANVLYGALWADGVHKSVDGGKTWTAINEGIKKDCKILEVAVSPGDSKELVSIGSSMSNWDGYVFWSDDGGRRWNQAARPKDDMVNNPAGGVHGLSRPTNITYCPTDPRKLYVSANWRPVFSEDGGRTWTERDRGADISCVYDVRFHGNRIYASCMDEGILLSDDNGRHWQDVWHGDEKTAGHYWRLAISDNHGMDRIVGTCSPWNNAYPNRVVVSEDGGKRFKVVNEGLLPFKPTPNTMWGIGYARAMAVDPRDPRIMYLGIDGDPTDGKPGGGIFKSGDGGYTWRQLPHQPGSRRMFFGLAVDPTDSRRIYWGACGNQGGLWRSEDGGESWQHVFQNETWVFNILVAADGTVYCPGLNMWRSTDHGKTWKKLTNLKDGQIVGLEADPRDPKTLWFSTIKHGGTAWGHIMKTTDGGATWQDITGDIGYRKPMVLRFNPATNELWAGGVGLFKTKQQ